MKGEDGQTEMNPGPALILLGVVLVAVGLALSVGGRLPGDISIRGKNWTFYFPLATCLVLSVILSLVFWLFGKRQ
jgi:uncharacterized membrane protein YidH (DUF202 family)